MYELFKNVTSSVVSTPAGAVSTVNCGGNHGRPPAPVEAVISSKSESHVPSTAAYERATTGVTGVKEATIAPTAVFGTTVVQSEQCVCETTHSARMVSAATTTTSPTCTSTDG